MYGIPGYNHRTKSFPPHHLLTCTLDTYLQHFSHFHPFSPWNSWVYYSFSSAPISWLANPVAHMCALDTKRTRERACARARDRKTKSRERSEHGRESGTRNLSAILCTSPLWAWEPFGEPPSSTDLLYWIAFCSAQKRKGKGGGVMTQLFHLKELLKWMWHNWFKTRAIWLYRLTRREKYMAKKKIMGFKNLLLKIYCYPWFFAWSSWAKFYSNKLTCRG